MVPPDSHRASPTPRYSGYSSESSITSTGVSPTMPCLSMQLRVLYNSLYKSYNPSRAVTGLVWALPRSLATTYGIIIIFFSCCYLDVSVHSVRLSLKRYSIARVGCPIRKFTNQSLFAAHRNLSQLITSFIASRCLGIHRIPFLSFLYTFPATSYLP
jgi:hypothetical protein